ncbi:MAG: hypothetical protein ACK4Y6_07085 [Bacteroidota bacterium]|jgi:hypothetical protein
MDNSSFGDEIRHNIFAISCPKYQGADYGVELVFTELCSSDLLTGFEVNPMYLLST